MIDFYTSNVQSPVCERVAIMLEECGLAYDPHVIEVGKGAKKPLEFLKVSPRGKIPALVDKSGPAGQPIAIVQAGAILLYLADKTGKFLPKELGRRAAIYQWLMCVLTDAQPTSMAAFLCGKAVPGKPESAQRFFENSFVELCKEFDRGLGEAAYLGGGEVSIADFALYPTAFYRRPLIDGAGGLRNLKRWLADMEARPAVQRVFDGWESREARLATVSL